MVEYRVPGAELLTAVVVAVCFVVALIVITMQEVSRSRTFGIVGVAFLFASTASQAINESLGSAYGTKTVVYAVGSIVVAAFGAIGLVLLALAVVWARKARRRRGDH